MTTAEILAGDLTANHEARVVSGLLLPFGEVGQTNLGQFTVDAGTITIPRDISTLVANEGHSMTEPRARFLTATETAAGIVASFKIGTNEDDDKLLARIEDGRTNGKPMALSVEVKGVTIKDGRATSGRLSGAAFVERGAFASAALMAAAVDTDEPEAVDAPVAALVPDESGDVTVTASETPSTVTVTAGDSSTVFTPEDTNTESETTVGNATVPGTLVAAAATEPEVKKLGKADLFAMIADAKNSGDSSTLMAALNDVKTAGASSVGVNSIVPEYVGEVWSGKTFQRRVIPLTGTGVLTSLSQKGFRFVVKPEVSEWAGDKANVPSNTPTTEAVNFAITRFAGGWDIAREFYDFGETEVIESFLRLAATDYAKKSDAKHLANLIAGATSAAVGTLPAGITAATAAIVRGALRVIAADGTPNYAIVHPGLYEQLMFTKKDDTLAFLDMGLTLEEGNLESFKIVPHTGMAAGTVLVGDKLAASAFELGGSPIRVNALDMVKGGVDEALFGYIQTRIEYPTGLQLVTTTV